MEHEGLRASWQDMVSTMSELQRQAMDGALFILKHEAAISASGTDPSDDGVLQMMANKMKEEQEQVKQLRTQMKEHEAARICSHDGRALEAGPSALSHVRARGKLDSCDKYGKDEED